MKFSGEFRVRLDALEKLVLEPKEGDTVRINDVEYRFADLSEMEQQLTERDAEIRKLTIRAETCEKRYDLYVLGEHFTMEQAGCTIIKLRDKVSERDALIESLRKELGEKGLRITELENALRVMGE